jgi:hypothetical protein
MKTWALALMLAAAPAQTPQEPKPVPSDSVLIVTTGCLKGRVFTATEPPEESMRRGPNVTGRNFRVNGPKDIIEQVKKENGHLIQIAGIVRKASLADNTPGARIGNTRVVIGTPRNSPMGSPGRPPVGDAPAVMDVTSVTFISETCPIVRR